MTLLVLNFHQTTKIKMYQLGTFMRPNNCFDFNNDILTNLYLVKSGFAELNLKIINVCLDDKYLDWTYVFISLCIKAQRSLN